MVFHDILITNKEQLLYKQTYSFFIHFCVLFFFFIIGYHVLCYFPCLFIFSFFLLYFLLPRETLFHYRAGHLYTLLISFVFCFIHTWVLSLSLKISFKAIKKQNQHRLIPLLPSSLFFSLFLLTPLFLSKKPTPPLSLPITPLTRDFPIMIWLLPWFLLPRSISLAERPSWESQTAITITFHLDQLSFSSEQ